MTYEQIKNLREKEFKRLCGVKPQIFEEMVSTLKQELPTSRNRGGQAKLSIKDQLLITLEYWREYRTYFHIAQSWRVHESTVFRYIYFTLCFNSHYCRLKRKVKYLSTVDLYRSAVFFCSFCNPVSSSS